MILIAKEIYSEIEADYRQILTYCREDNVIGIFSKGSYNRNLEDDFSDLDTTILVFEEIGIDTIQPWSKRLGTISILTFEDFKKKLNICGFLVWDETLFAKYYRLNPQYKDIFFLLMEMREEIFLAQPRRFALSVLLNMQYSMSMIPEYEKVEKNGSFLTYKQLSHLVREKELLEHFLECYPNITFIELNSLSDRPQDYILYLKKLKRGYIQLNENLTITEYAQRILLEGVQCYKKIQAITKPDEDKAIFIKMNCILAELEKQRKEK